MRVTPLLCLLLLACAPRLVEGTYLIEPGQQLLLSVGEHLKADLKAENLLTFVEVVEDSRCPRDVQCIQAGQAVVRIRVLRDGVLTEENVIVDGRAIATDRGPLELSSLEPYPDTSGDAPEPYRLSLRLGE